MVDFMIIFGSSDKKYNYRDDLRQWRHSILIRSLHDKTFGPHALRVLSSIIAPLGAFPIDGSHGVRIFWSVPCVCPSVRALTDAV